MREIKFRTWQKMPISSSFYMEYNPPLEYREAYINEVFIEQDRDFHKDRVFMQWTGLKDKNGKEIWEGDIVKQEYSKVISVSYDENSYGVDDVEQVDGHHIGEVVIIASKGVCLKKPLHYSEDEGSWSTSNQYKDVAGYRSEVIGNKFDNPELLEGAHHD